jgi:methyl-accepting chemotaxis protein
MTPKNVRHPFRHFFIKRSIQYRIIAKILFVVALTAVITTVSLTYIYNSKSRNGTFYYMSNDSKQDLELKNVLEVILPSVVGAQLFSIIVGLGIGLFSSRKIAVPIYKFEKWVSQLKTGNLNTTISFRETEQMKDLTVQCNALTEYYKEVFTAIDTAATALEKEAYAGNPAAAEQVKRLRKALQKISFN